MNSLLRRQLCFTLAFLAAVVLAMGSPFGAVAQVAPDDDSGSPVRLSPFAIAHTLFDAVLNEGDIEAAALIVAEDASIHTPLGDFTGPEGLVAFAEILRRANPDGVFDITSIDVQGDIMGVSWRMSAMTYQIDPTEGPVSVLVEREGTATIVNGDDAISGLSINYGTVVSPLPSEGVELAGAAEHRGLPY